MHALHWIGTLCAQDNIYSHVLQFCRYHSNIMILELLCLLYLDNGVLTTSVCSASVQGGRDGKSYVFRSNMTHNHKQCVVFYLEEDYAQLVFECYWTIHGRVKMSNDDYKFFCIHYKESHKDKNTMSYHMMFKLFWVYEGTNTLKMYPTWDNSEHGEKHRIGLKYEKRESPSMSSTPSMAKCPLPLDLDGEATSTKCIDADSAAKTSPPHNPRVVLV